jgi:hypothetical protein
MRTGIAMTDRLLADLLVVLHLLFIAFVILGGLSVLYRRWLAWVHLPAALWGILIEATGWICPLTPLENRLRLSAGQQGYHGGFVEHYILPVVYPGGLTRTGQWVIGGLVLAVNIAIYVLVVRRLRKRT